LALARAKDNTPKSQSTVLPQAKAF
jgi:hypothetical protein